MARPNKKHHKIPSTYLNGFTDNNGQLWVADRSLKLYPQKPENLLTENDYYTVRFKTGGGTLNIETNFLGGIEGKFAEIYKTKLKDKKPIEVEEKAHLSIFLASMMERQPINRLSMKKFFDDVKEKIDHLESMSDKAKKRMEGAMIPPSGPTFTSDEMLEAGKDVGSFHSSLIPETVIDIAPILFNMNWLFLVRSTDSDPFMTSDNPTVMVRPVAEQKFGEGSFGAVPGLAFKDVEITLPISSDLALMCSWEQKLDCVYVPVDKTIVNQVNTRTLRHGYQIISADKQMIERIIERMKNNQMVLNQ